MQRSSYIPGQSWQPSPKSRIMKLSKALLAAMLTGITLQGVESCTKKKDDPSKKEQKEKEKEEEGKPKPPPYPFNCPACGMG